MTADHVILQLFVTCIVGMFAYFFGEDRGRKAIQHMLIDREARATAENALSAVARLREELSELRGNTHRDRDELRDIANKHERAIVNSAQSVKDAVDTCMREATKIAMHISPSGQRKIG